MVVLGGGRFLMCEVPLQGSVSPESTATLTEDMSEQGMCEVPLQGSISPQSTATLTKDMSEQGRGPRASLLLSTRPPCIHQRVPDCVRLVSHTHPAKGRHRTVDDDPFIKTQLALTLACVVHIWSRNTPDSGPNETIVVLRVNICLGRTVTWGGASAL